MAVPRSILSPQLLPASIAIFTTLAIVAFEGLAITAALPEVAGDLGNVEFLPWVITSFLLASAVATAISGTLIDAIGTSTVFRWATTLFAASSLVAAAANSMAILVASRIVQGAAGGAIISVGIAAVALVYPKHLTGRALAANSNVWGVLGFASPAIAAALLEIGSWRWIFLLMAPICLIALAVGWRRLPKAVEPTPLVVDWLSAGLLVLTVGFLLAAVSDVSTTSIILVAAATISGTVLWRRLRRTDSPLVDPQYLQAAPYAHLAASASLALAAIGGLSAYLPVYVRGARGGSASLAAWSVLWMTIGWTFAANIAGRVTDRIAERTVMAVGAVLAPVGVLIAWLTVTVPAPLPVVFAAYFLMGTAVGAVTNSALQLVRRVVPPPLAGRATSAHAFLRTMGMSLGAGLAGGTILAVTATRLSDVSEVEAALTGTGDTLAGSAANALANGFQVAHLASLVLVVVGAVVTWRIYERLPASGHDRNPA